MGTILDFSDYHKETRLEAFKRKVGGLVRASKDFIVNNKEAILLSAPVIIGGLATITKVVGRRINLHKEERVKNLYCYDRSLGHYWALRRELSNQEWTEIDKRKNNGERMADILNALKVLK